MRAVSCDVVKEHIGIPLQVPCLIFINKLDQPNGMNIAEIAEGLNLSDLAKKVRLFAGLRPDLCHEKISQDS